MILITGAGGFIGSILVAEFARRAIPYRAVARSSSNGYLGIGNIDANTDWGFALEGVDVIVDLASRVPAMGHPIVGATDKIRSANLETSMNLARQAASAGVRRYVFISSIKVNGEFTAPDSPFTATDKPNPQDMYAQCKLDVEQSLFELSRQCDLEVTVIRPPLVYGPGVKANFASLIRSVERGIPLPLGSVNNKRSLLFAGNLADLLIRAARHPNAKGQVFLASDAHDVSTAELLGLIAKALGRKSPVFSFPTKIISLAAASVGRPGVARRLLGSLQIDATKTQSMLEWTPPWSVSEGVFHTANAFRSLPGDLNDAIRSV